MANILDGQLSALDLLEPPKLVAGRIECPHCASHWGLGLKQEVLDRLAAEHEEVAPGICRRMVDLKEAVPGMWDRHNGTEPGWSLTLEKPAPPPLMVNLSAWQVRSCGWCKKVNTIGGAAVRHPEHHNISIYYEYCEKCCTKYGDPKLWEPGFKFWVNEQPGPDPEKNANLADKIAAWRTATTKETS